MSTLGVFFTIALLVSVGALTTDVRALDLGLDMDVA